MPLLVSSLLNCVFQELENADQMLIQINNSEMNTKNRKDKYSRTNYL